MKEETLTRWVGKHVTLVTQPTNQPICPEAIVEIFSGILHDVSPGGIILKYPDGTQGIFAVDKLVGIVENLSLPPGPDLNPGEPR